MMPKSSATYLPWCSASTATKMLPGCMSAWKKPSRNTCVKKISTPARDEALEVDSRRASASSIRPIGMPAIRSITSTSACGPVPVDLGHAAAAANRRKLRRSCEQFAASRVRSSSSWIVLSNSATTSRGRRRRPSLHSRSTSDRGRLHQREVVLDDGGDVRAQYLDRDRRAVGKLREMDLRDRRARDRHRVERAEDLVDRLAVDPRRAPRRPARTETAARDPAASRARRRCRSASRSRRVDSICPNLTKIGPRSSSAWRSRTAARHRQIAPEQRAADERPQPARALVSERQVVEPVLQRDGDDAGKAQDAHARDCTGGGIRYRTKRGRRLRGGFAGLVALFAATAEDLSSAIPAGGGGDLRAVLPALIARSRPP